MSLPSVMYKLHHHRAPVRQHFARANEHDARTCSLIEIGQEPVLERRQGMRSLAPLRPHTLRGAGEYQARIHVGEHKAAYQ